MKPVVLLNTALLFLCCNNNTLPEHRDNQQIIQKENGAKNGWPYFLQHLPQENSPILDYTGTKVEDQEKHAAILKYDVGTRDLQQCADALMRLRAEYLFAQKRYNEISFHFVSGQAYSFTAYCHGSLPVPKGNIVSFINSRPKPKDPVSLRNYLDLVYTYASTISLADELTDATDFAIGTIVIKAGSPGHCFIITDEAITATGEKVYKLVEGYTPAQSIYVLRNINEPLLNHWHRLSKGPITTASYQFSTYRLKKFE